MQEIELAKNNKSETKQLGAEACYHGVADDVLINQNQGTEKNNAISQGEAVASLTNQVRQLKLEKQAWKRERINLNQQIHQLQVQLNQRNQEQAAKVEEVSKKTGFFGKFKKN